MPTHRRVVGLLGESSEMVHGVVHLLAAVGNCAYLNISLGPAVYGRTMTTTSSSSSASESWCVLKPQMSCVPLDCVLLRS